MATLVLLLLSGYGLFMATWLFFLAIMSLRHRKNDPIGLLLDALFNVAVGTLLFLELPHEWLFTQRCDRWLQNLSWRGTLARGFCRNLLDPFDLNGRHCR